MKRIVILALFAALTLPLLPTPAQADDPALAAKLRNALVVLHTTSQSYNTTSPWKRSRQSTRTGRGVLVGPGVILTPASNVTYQQMIEFSVVNSARRYPAKLRHVDHRLGLALVEITDPEMKAKMQPLPLGDPIKLDDELEIHQLGRDNMLERFTGRVVRANAWSTQLSLTVKTNCSDSGNGQVALNNGKIVGLVTSTWSSRQEGTILSLETIRHYMDDFADDAYNGCPGAGPFTLDLLRTDLRTYYGVSEDQHGVAVTRVPADRSGAGVLEENDVILKLDGYDIDDEGKFQHETHGRLNMGYLMSGRRYVGDKIPVTVLRGGKELTLEMELKGQPKGKKQIPTGVIETRPQFVVTGGLVILELTGRSPIGRSSEGVILRRYRERAGWDAPDDRTRIVYADRAMPDVANKGMDGVRHQAIETVNGKRISAIEDVVKALEAPQGKFHVFRFEGVTSDYAIPVSDYEALNKRIAETYRITKTRYIKSLGDE
ncbi:MAG: hypothetical protein QNJ98_06485 [Planctomycetota bacterium]|nr:hypothetical protein [Planctomycetota bacterium]